MTELYAFSPLLRAVDSPPRLRAKCVGFIAPFQGPPNRACTGPDEGFRGSYLLAIPCKIAALPHVLLHTSSLGPLILKVSLKQRGPHLSKGSPPVPQHAPLLDP